MPLRIICKSFDELTAGELYDSLYMRQEVFIEEQNCRVPDLDRKDRRCHHLMIYDQDTLVAYARLLPAGMTFQETSIGRVATHAKSRGTGLGKILMQEALRNCYAIYGKTPIRIAAQHYARKFYEKLGFTAVGEVYDHDGIDHVDMVRLPDDLGR